MTNDVCRHNPAPVVLSSHFPEPRPPPPSPDATPQPGGAAAAWLGGDGAPGAVGLRGVLQLLDQVEGLGGGRGAGDVGAERRVSTWLGKRCLALPCPTDGVRTT